jgi:hypothetical protein
MNYIWTGTWPDGHMTRHYSIAWRAKDHGPWIDAVVVVMILLGMRYRFREPTLSRADIAIDWVVDVT